MKSFIQSAEDMLRYDADTLVLMEITDGEQYMFLCSQNFNSFVWSNESQETNILALLILNELYQDSLKDTQS